MAWVLNVASLVVLWVASLCELITRFNCLRSISRARPPNPTDVPKKDEGDKQKRRVRERCKSQGKKKERKVFLGLVCGTHKTIEIIEWCELKTVAKQVGIRKLGYFKWWMMNNENWVRSDERWKKKPNRA